MKKDLQRLRQELEAKRNTVVAALKEIDDNLGAIDRISGLVDAKTEDVTADQLPIFSFHPASERYAGVTLKDAIMDLLEEDPKKYWAPKEVIRTLVKRGFPTEAKNFGNNVRTMLYNLRRKGKVSSIKSAKGYVVGLKKEESEIQATPAP